jgi:transcriptional regulator with XRE-family HTH domain
MKGHVYMSGKGMKSMIQRASLRQLARELGVSHSYLSQVLNGKRPASEKVAYGLTRAGILSVNGKQQMVSKYDTRKLLEKNKKMTYNEINCGCNSAVECLLPKQYLNGYSRDISNRVPQYQ